MASHSGPQRLLGPVLVQPYTRAITVEQDGKHFVRKEQVYRYLLPDRLDVRASMEVTPRKLGIYQAQIYQGRLSLSGRLPASLADKALVAGNPDLSFDAADPALIPGKPAPKLITKEMVDSMKPGSVIVDLASAAGGNCEYTVPGELAVTDSGVKVIGYTDLPGRLPTQSSQLYATNLVNLAKLWCKEKDGNINLDFNDVVLRNMTVVHQGEVTFPPPAISVSAAPKQEAAKPAAAKVEEKKPCKSKKWLGAVGLGLFGLLGHVAPPEFLSHFTVFVLACVVGYYVVWNVSHSLHTPLMSVTNAISGIIVVGALLQIGSGSGLVSALAFVAVLIATINIVGGFTVTQRMLKMFRKG